MRTVQLRTIRAGLVQHLGGICPPLDQVFNLRLFERPRLAERHAHRGCILNVRRRDGRLDDIVRDLPASVRELTNAEHAMALGGGDDRLERLHRIPVRVGVDDRILLGLETITLDRDVAEHDRANLTLAPLLVQTDVLGCRLATLRLVVVRVRA